MMNSLPNDHLKIRVLIVDDDQDVLNAIACVLSLDERFIIKVATNTESAINLLDDYQPDHALIDIRLGSSSGLDLIPVFKERLPNIQCIIMTGYREVEYAVSAIRNGADEYLLKPVDPENLMNILTSFQDKGLKNIESGNPMNIFLEESSELKFLLDAEGRLVDAAKNTLEFARVGLDDVLSVPFHNTPWWSHSELVQEDLRGAIEKAQNGVSSRLEASMIDGENNSLWYEFKVRPLSDPDGNKIIIIEGNDITRHKIAEQKLTLLAHSDPLTGLSNRVSLENQMRQVIAYSSRNKTNFSVMFVDIDNFKKYNDEYGHQAGDELLIQISEHIKYCAREEDIVARIGGDEFVIVLTSAKLRTDALIISNRIKDMVSSIRHCGHDKMEVSISIGLSFYPGDGESASELLNNADKAMYAAKKLAKNKARLSDNTLDEQREIYMVGNKDRNTIHREEKNTRILIVDDDFDILDSLKDVLLMSNENYEIKTATSVDQAKTISIEFKPDIALLDIKLGRDNGLLLIPQLKEEKEDLVCIMMTAFRDADYAVTAVRFGANDYLYKPIDPRRLISTIERAVENINLKHDREESDRRFKAIFEQTFQWLILLDCEGNIVEVNEETLNFSGIEYAEVVGKKIWDAEWWGSSLSLKNRIKSTTKQAQEGVFIREEMAVKSQDGDNITLDLSMKPIQSIDKEVIQIIVECRDVTERKNTENLLVEAREDLEGRILERTLELQKAKKQAEKISEEKSELLSRMSHELRTPLNSVLGFGQLLSMSNDELGEEQKEAVDNIISGGRNLLNLVNEVLDITEVDSGSLELFVARLSIKDSLKSVTSLVKPLAEKNGITINQCMSDDAYVMADLNRFNKVLFNLMQNAVKFNHDGGSVSITIEGVNNGFMRINIADTGMGIKPDDQKGLFDPFARVGGSASAVEGVGLGLSISKKLVELMGGKIGFESEYGSGSTFWFELPVA
jgi:diguanylate cyclase (GGDEF)-like protein/PAS domain S-box-containing protein